MVRPSLFFLAALAGCGGSTTAEAPDAGADTASARDSSSLGPTSTRPPPRPSEVGAGGATMWFAVSRLQLGMTKRSNGAVSNIAWQEYGYNIDARLTTSLDSKTSEFSCKRVAGSPTNVLADSGLGRDNNFGQHAMAVIKSLMPDAESLVNSVITDGKATLLLKLSNVGDPNNASVPGELYLAALRGSCDAGWAIDESSVDTAGAAKMRFPNGYMSVGTWVSGDVGEETVVLPLPWPGSPRLTLVGGVITLDLTGDSGGMIAGAAPPANLIAALDPLLAARGICRGNATYEQVTATVQQSCDLFLAGTLLQDTTQTCDGVSVGLGFVAQPIAAPACRTAGPTAPPGECG